MPWLLYALVSAVAAAVTALLAKIGVEGVPRHWRPQCEPWSC
jgi:uncharacterized membrane protein